MKKNCFNSILSITEVADALKLKNSESVLKWLEKNEVPIHNFGLKGNRVYELDFNCALAIPFANQIKKQHPDNWKEILKEISPDNSHYNMLLLKIGDNASAYSFVKPVKPKTPSEKKLIDDLLK